MTKAQREVRERRERIAAAALQGLLANPEFVAGADDSAVHALQFADALIEELDDD